jgi:hypothetical protein
MTRTSNDIANRVLVTGTLVAAVVFLTAAATAQGRFDVPVSEWPVSFVAPEIVAPLAHAKEISEAANLLPDAPLPADAVSPDLLIAPPPLALAGSVAGGTNAPLLEASHTQKYIEPGQPAPSLSAGDKVLLGLKDAFSPFAAAGWVSAAGFSQAINSSPNYGTDSGAFGQRLGAAVIRDSSEGIFSDSVMSPLLREDPRYYRLGPAHNFFLRVVYAATRPIITRTDGGRTTPNFALIAGNLAGSALTNAYYPAANRGVEQTMKTLAGSLEGSAVGDVVGEFFEDLLDLVHIKHK